MVNTEPLKEYLEAIDAYNNGNKEKALELLANSVGAPGPTKYMESALGKLSEPNIAILTLLLNEIKGDNLG